MPRNYPDGPEKAPRGHGGLLGLCVIAWGYCQVEGSNFAICHWGAVNVSSCFFLDQCRGQDRLLECNLGDLPPESGARECALAGERGGLPESSPIEMPLQAGSCGCDPATERGAPG